MELLRRRWILAGLAVLLATPAAAADPIAVVAAENFYGDVAQQIGGPRVRVTSILNKPEQDPHLFEASASVARDLSEARIVIFNGIDYDPWVQKLLAATTASERKTIAVAPLVGHKAGDNPHIWYDPATMPALATALADEFGSADPVHRCEYQQRLLRFLQSLQPVEAKVTALRQKLAGTPATATEPVFGYMFAALGMPVRNERLQLAAMNNTEPSAADVAAFEDDLRGRRVRLLVYNGQAASPVVRRLVKVARSSQVPVVAVTETEPPGQTYQEWMLSELEALDQALQQ